MLSNNYYNPFGEKCLKEEEIGRKVGEMCLKEFLNGYKYTLEFTDLTSSVDLRGTVECLERDYPFCAEIKQRMKSEKTLKNFPDCELRVDKALRMLKEAKGTDLLYIVLLNEKECYIFNLKLIDWCSIEKCDWRIKKVQVNQKSDYDYFQIYRIPTSLAIAKIDCSEYFKLVKSPEKN